MGRVEGWGGAPDRADPVRPSALLDLGTGLQVDGTLRSSPRGGSLDRAGPGEAGRRWAGRWVVPRQAAVRIELVQEGRGPRWAGRWASRGHAAVAGAFLALWPAAEERPG